MRGKYAAAVVGCRTNQYEEEALKHQLELLGFVKAADGERADLCLVHTCAVTEQAERRFSSSQKYSGANGGSHVE